MSIVNEMENIENNQLRKVDVHVFVCLGHVIAFRMHITWCLTTITAIVARSKEEEKIGRKQQREKQNKKQPTEEKVVHFIARQHV